MKKNRIFNLILILVFLAGLSLLLYPTVSNYWNSIHQSQAIVDYDQKLDELTEETYSRLWSEAEEWNRTTAHRIFALNEEQKDIYYNLLDPSDRNILGYLEIPSIGCTLPVGHGTGDDVLTKSVGHLEWSSLPVGGEGTHCILSGHRGLPSSELLTNIDHMEVGDRFSLHILNEELVYQVDRISVVEPDDLSLLGIEKEKDYVTLVTCTPYGINSHRLLVRGVRVDTGTNTSVTLTVPGEGSIVNSLLPAFLVLLALLLILFLALLLFGNRPKKRRGGARLLQEPHDKQPS